MKIEVHIRERDTRGNFLGRRNAFVESCRVFKEAGDSMRMDNMATVTQQFFAMCSKFYAKAWREAKTHADFLAAISPIVTASTGRSSQGF